jgi:hypothetical protein
MTPLLFSRVNQPLPCGRGSANVLSRDRKGADAQLFLTLCLDAAAKVYPLGLESLMAAKPAMTQPGAGTGGGFIYGGSGSGPDRRLAMDIWSAGRGDAAAIPR